MGPERFSEADNLLADSDFLLQAVEALKTFMRIHAPCRESFLTFTEANAEALAYVPRRFRKDVACMQRGLCMWSSLWSSAGTVIRIRWQDSDFVSTLACHVVLKDRVPPLGQ